MSADPIPGNEAARLQTQPGLRVGTLLCLIDSKPRQLDAADLAILRDLVQDEMLGQAVDD